MDYNNEKYYTTKEIAQRYGVTATSVRVWIRNGELPAIQIGNSYRVKQSDLALFEQKRRRLIPSKIKTSRRRQSNEG